MNSRNVISAKGYSFRREGLACLVGASLLLVSCQKPPSESLPVLSLPSGTSFILVQPKEASGTPPPSGKPGSPYIGVLSGIVQTGDALVVTGYQGTILRHTHHGPWARMPVPVHADFYGITRTPSGTLWVAGDNGILLRSRDSGKTWQSVETGASPLFINAVSFPSDTVGFAVGEKGLLLKTTDGGDHWRKLSSTTEKNLYAVVFTDESHGLVAGWHSTLLRTENGGQTFEPIEIPSQKVTRQKPSFNSLWAGGGLLFLAGDHGLLFESSDRGRTFAQIETGTLSDFYGVCRTASGTLGVAGEQGMLLLLDSDRSDHWTRRTPLGSFNGSDFLGISCGSTHVRLVGTRNAVLLPSQTP